LSQRSTLLHRHTLPTEQTQQKVTASVAGLHSLYVYRFCVSVIPQTLVNHNNWQVFWLYPHANQSSQVICKQLLKS